MISNCCRLVVVSLFQPCATFTLNNSRFGDFVDLIYPIEREIKDTSDTDRSVSYLGLHIEIGSEGRL